MSCDGVSVPPDCLVADLAGVLDEPRKDGLLLSDVVLEGCLVLVGQVKGQLVAGAELAELGALLAL